MTQMMTGRLGGLNVAFSADYLNAAGIISLLSVMVLVGLFFYLNRYTGRAYFSIWTVGWLFYACWLGLGLEMDGFHGGPLLIMLKHWCVGASAALLFWGSAQFLKTPLRPVLFYLFLGFLLVWSYVGAYHLKEPLQMRVPIFGTIGLASLVTAFSFYRLRKHREFIGAGLVCFGFSLWGAYLIVSPFFAVSDQMVGTGFLVAAVLQLFIAVSMIILVLEEARATTELLLNRIRGYEFLTSGSEGRPVLEPGQYQGLFDQSALGAKLQEAYQDLRLVQERSLQEERLQALSQMSRGIAHDINNALTPILGYANLILTVNRDLPESVLNHVRGIKTAGEKISKSVACIRDFYRKEQGEGRLVPVELNGLIGELIETTRAEWQKSRRDPGTTWTLDSETDTHELRIPGQKAELRDALAEIIKNSVDALPQGGAIKIRTELLPATETESAAGRPDHVVVEISDTGAGMDEDTRKRCLEPFFSTKNTQGAKGLGLSRVFGAMQRHGGQIEIESTPGQGTLVRLVFPAAKAETAAPQTVVPESAVLPWLKILCVDDEAPVLDVLRVMLESGGHTVEIAGGAPQAIQKFRAADTAGEPFDLVITDLAMPGMDGRDLADCIKAGSPDTPVIMVTGWGDIMKVEGVHPDKIDAVLSKPPIAKELSVTLRRLFAKAVPAV